MREMYRIFRCTASEVTVLCSALPSNFPLVRTSHMTHLFFPDVLIGYYSMTLPAIRLCTR